MKWVILTGLGVLLAAATLPALAQVQVRVEGAVDHPGVLNLKDSARLSDAALAAQVQPEAYMLGAAWLRPSLQSKQQRLKAGVLFDLDSLHLQSLQRGNAALAEEVGRLRNRIAALPVTGRMPALLDPRPVEANATANLPLQSGDRLFYPVRPATIRIVGAVQQPCTLPLQPMQDARIYLAACPYSRRADHDWIYVIEPDGRVFHRGVALWNRSQPLSLAPGAVIYVPLPARTARRVDATLNHDVAAFLATQTLPSPGSIEKVSLHSALPRKPESVSALENPNCVKPLTPREMDRSEGSATPRHLAPSEPSPGCRHPLTREGTPSGSPQGEEFTRPELRGVTAS